METGRELWLVRCLNGGERRAESRMTRGHLTGDSEAGPGPPCGQWEGSPEPDTECGHCRRCLPSPGGRDHFKNTSTKSCFFNSCVTLDKLLNFSGPQVPHLKSRDDSRDCL